jgi:hypothetical protein
LVEHYATSRPALGQIFSEYSGFSCPLLLLLFGFMRLLALRPLLAYCASLGVIVKVIVEKQMECRLAGETEVLGEKKNLPQRHFRPSQNSTRPDPGLNPGRRGGKPATNRLSYGAAYFSCQSFHQFLHHHNQPGLVQ